VQADYVDLNKRLFNSKLDPSSVRTNRFRRVDSKVFRVFTRASLFAPT
jgi:hypothetical protein